MRRLAWMSCKDRSFTQPAWYKVRKNWANHPMSEELISTLFPILVIGLIALVVGAVVGYVLASLSRQVAPPEPNRSKSLTELARLWRDRRTGKVAIEMDGKMLSSAAALSAAQRDNLTQAADELQLWLGAGDLVGRAMMAPAAAIPDPSPPAPAAPPPAQPVPAAVKPVAAATAEALVASEPEVKPPSMELRDILSRAFTTDKSKAAKPLKSIAAQVDEIVQERLPGSPFKNHLITLTEMPGGGLLVKVDNDRYEGVGDVPDPEIQGFLRECVAEWERRTENV